MRTKIQKWGNSLAVRIPIAMARALELEEASSVELRQTDGCIELRPTAPQPYSLDELLEGIRPENVHREVATGETQGAEVW